MTRDTFPRELAGDIPGRATTRRQFLTVGTGVFVALSLPLAMRKRTSFVRRTMPLMGTIAELQVAHHDERVAEAAIDAALAELSWVERTMTRFDARSDIGRANMNASRDGVLVTPESAHVVSAALAWSIASNGRFDPAIGAVSELWDVLNRHEPPPDAPVHRLAARGLWRKVDVATLGGRPALRFGDRDIHLDLGAIAKGYGIDRATNVLREKGIEHAIVTVGGDLYALGESPDGGPWTIGIRNPHDLNGLAATLDVSNRAVATSGDYERFFRWRGKRYHHLMDPATAAPRVTPIRSVTVLADHAIDADGASTTVFGLQHDDAERIVRAKLPGADVIPLT